MNSELTPREIAQKTSPIIAAISAIVSMALLHALDSIHLWALAILVGLVMEYLSALLIEWSVNKFIYKRVQLLTDAISKFKEGSTDLTQISAKKAPEDDSTDLIQWANQQVESIQKMHAKDNFRKEFIGNLAHELKTPLFNIQGFVLTLLESDLENKELNRKFLSKASKNIARMAELLDDLDTIARLESASFEMRLEPVNITRLIQDTLEGFELKAKQNNITLSLSIASEIELDSMVLCGESQMRQVLTNLIGNSIHYGQTNGHTQVALSLAASQIKVVVEDDGIGMSAEDQERIFERFYRVDRSRSRNAGGSGLGLAIVKHILEAHGQDIHLTSELGEGTSFKFHLQRISVDSLHTPSR